jgi:hypothetical protein
MQGPQDVAELVPNVSVLPTRHSAPGNEGRASGERSTWRCATNASTGATTLSPVVEDGRRDAERGHAALLPRCCHCVIRRGKDVANTTTPAAGSVDWSGANVPEGVSPKGHVAYGGANCPSSSSYSTKIPEDDYPYPAHPDGVSRKSRTT